MTLYDHHKSEVQRGYEPFPFAHLLDGAPFDWRRFRRIAFAAGVVGLFALAILEVWLWG
jgi:hypothetical protein